MPGESPPAGRNHSSSTGPPPHPQAEPGQLPEHNETHGRRSCRQDGFCRDSPRAGAHHGGTTPPRRYIRISWSWPYQSEHHSHTLPARSEIPSGDVQLVNGKPVGLSHLRASPECRSNGLGYSPRARMPTGRSPKTRRSKSQSQRS